MHSTKNIYSRLIISLVTLLLLFPAFNTTHANQLPTIGVYHIDANTSQLSRLLTESLSSDLAKMKSCYIVERDKLDQVFSEQALSYDGIVESLQNGSGQAIGLDYLLIGSANANVTRKYNSKYRTISYYNNVTINLKLVDAHQQIGKIIWSGQRSVDSINDTGDITDLALEIAYDMSRQLYEQEFPLNGYVIKIANGKYYLDIGAEDGVTTKDKFIIQHADETLIHPVTGEIIPVNTSSGTLKIIEVYENYAIAVLDDDDHINIAIKDKVIKKIKNKPKDWTGLLWSGKVVF